MTTKNGAQARLILSGLVPFAFVAVLTAYLVSSGGLLDVGVQLPEVTIEEVRFADAEIRATVRNTGPVPVELVMADVNDRIQPAAVEPDGSLERYESATVRIPFDWNEAEPYAVGITIEDGTRFERVVEAAAPAQEPSADMVALLAVVGTFVGIVPVMIGLSWLPFIRRIGADKHRFFLAVTAGLLVFLALDSVEEALDVSDQGIAGIFNGTMLVATVVILSFLALYHMSRRLAGGNASQSSPIMVALMISVGIGLHNYAEGLAIGAAVGIGSAAFGAFLVVGFALHNTTEGLAIAAPFSNTRARLPILAALGLIAGAPAILGAWTGGFAYSPFASAIFLAVGAGAIVQVVLVLAQWLRSGGRSLADAPVVSGMAVGLLVMYLTSVLV